MDVVFFDHYNACLHAVSFQVAGQNDSASVQSRNSWGVSTEGRDLKDIKLSSINRSVAWPDVVQVAIQAQREMRGLMMKDSAMWRTYPKYWDALATHRTVPTHDLYDECKQQQSNP